MAGNGRQAALDASRQPQCQCHVEKRQNSLVLYGVHSRALKEVKVLHITIQSILVVVLQGQVGSYGHPMAGEYALDTCIGTALSNNQKGQCSHLLTHL